MSIFAKSTGNTREGQRDVRLVLPEVRRSVAIATAFSFLCWAWHVRCHMHGSVLEHCFRLSSQNRKELHIRNPQKNPSKIGSLIDIKPLQGAELLRPVGEPNPRG